MVIMITPTTTMGINGDLLMTSNDLGNETVATLTKQLLAHNTYGGLLDVLDGKKQSPQGRDFKDIAELSRIVEDLHIPSENCDMASELGTASHAMQVTLEAMENAGIAEDAADGTLPGLHFCDKGELFNAKNPPFTPMKFLMSITNGYKFQYGLAERLKKLFEETPDKVSGLIAILESNLNRYRELANLMIRKIAGGSATAQPAPEG